MVQTGTSQLIPQTESKRATDPMEQTRLVESFYKERSHYICNYAFLIT
jgi:hypothetical protein